MFDKPNQPVQLNRTPETSSPRGISLFPTEKGFPAWDFGFPTQEERFPVWDFTFPAWEKQFPRGILLFPFGESDFLRACGYVSTRG